MIYLKNKITMEKKVKIIKCKKEDFIWVFSLLQQLRPKREFVIKDAKKTFNDALQSDNQFYFCARQEKKIIWFGSLTIKQWLYAMGKVAVLDELIVDAKHRQQWIAKELIDYILDFAKAKTCVCIELECWLERQPAHAFYEKYWFDKGTGCFFSKDLV